MVLVIVISLLTITGCGEKESEGTTIGTKLASQFKEEIASSQDLNKVAEALTKNTAVKGIDMATMECEEGYLNGFTEEVYGFSKCVMFSPYIGSIPFIGYVFETDTPDTLKADLESKAMLNWNICTVADELVIESDGNYVFFCMAPNSFDE